MTNNIPTLIVGDLHGQYEIAEAVLNSGYPVIFIGDYLDSYDRPVREQIWTLLLVLNAVETRDDVSALKGNHELSYILPGHVCSGWNKETNSHVVHLKERMNTNLEDYIWLYDKYLISHAGVSNALLEYESTNLNDYLKAKEYYQVGYRRGGNHPIGGLYWCDWYDGFEPIIGVPQIVGHSGYRKGGDRDGILQSGNSYNVDCFQQSDELLLVYPDKEPEIHSWRDYV